MQLDSVTTMGLKWIFSSQTYNLPPFTCEETAKSLDLLVLKSPLNLWKASPEDRNLPWETICNETNSEEIRSLQDFIVFRTGIGDASKQENTAPAA